MVRESYNWTQYLQDIGAASIRQISHLGAIKGSNASITGNWIVDWNFLLEGSGQSNEKQFAAPIQSHLTGDLSQLDDAWIDADMLQRVTRPYLNLAEITLLRGCDVELASGQDVARHVASCLKSPDEVPTVPDDEMFADLPIDRGTDEGKLIHSLEGATPLWFYCLREAEVLGACGMHLGPMASRIVLETIHAAIEASPHSVMGNKDFKVLKGLRTESDRSIHLDEILRMVQAEAAREPQTEEMQ